MGFTALWINQRQELSFFKETLSEVEQATRLKRNALQQEAEHERRAGARNIAIVSTAVKAIVTPVFQHLIKATARKLATSVARGSAAFQIPPSVKPIPDCDFEQVRDELTQFTLIL